VSQWIRPTNLKRKEFARSARSYGMRIFVPSLEPERKPMSSSDLYREAASRAGQTLAIRRRIVRQGPDKRRWTGVVFNGKRAWVGQPVILPDNSVGWIKAAQAGFVCVRTTVMDSEHGAVHDYLEAVKLRPYRLPEAVLLGSLKRGKVEKKSAAKSDAARRNGSKPPRPGSRPRGRPRKPQPTIPGPGTQAVIEKLLSHFRR
jgi:hypothetical protein